MGRPDFGELVAALKTGAAKGERFQPAKPGNFDGARDRKVVDAWLAEMDDYLHAAKVGFKDPMSRFMRRSSDQIMPLTDYNPIPNQLHTS